MNFRTLDLNLLRVFDAVMTDRSLTRAAQSLAMTQPAVSHALKRLHAAVGETLFTRSATGMTPTARAEALWPHVRAALVRLRQALAPTDFQPEVDAVSFRVAMVDAVAAMLLPPLVAAIEHARAQANLRVLPLGTREPRPLLERSDADLAVGYFPHALAAVVAEGRDSAFRHARLYETDYVCVMRAGHALAGRPLTLDDFCAAEHLLVSFSGRPHGFVDEALTALGRQRRIVLTVNQFFTAARVVLESDLLTVLPSRFVVTTGLADRLAVAPLPLQLGPVQVEMVWHMRRDDDPAHLWLRTQVLQAAAQVA